MTYILAGSSRSRRSCLARGALPPPGCRDSRLPAVPGLARGGGVAPTLMPRELGAARLAGPVCVRAAKPAARPTRRSKPEMWRNGATRGQRGASSATRVGKPAAEEDEEEEPGSCPGGPGEDQPLATAALCRWGK